MNEKKWIKIWFVFVFMIPVLGIFNYLVDPYGFNHFVTIEGINSEKNSNTTLTTRFKSNVLEEGNITTIMLGTSKMGVMNPEVVDKYLGGKTFNLAYPGSVAEIHNKLFFYALKYNHIKNLVYAIDLMSFNKSRTLKYDFQEFYELEGKITKKKPISNYDLYFNFDTLKKSILLLYKNMRGERDTKIIYSRNGMRKHFNYIEALDHGTYQWKKEVYKEMRHYYLPDGIYKKYQFSTSYLESFREIILFCKKNNIKVWVYVPPTYIDFFSALVPAGYYDAFELFKRELVKITDFTDFSGNNTFNRNINNYWDGVHLREEFTETIMSDLFNEPFKKGSKKFGIFVREDNIEAHLQNLRKQIGYYDLNKTIYK